MFRITWKPIPLVLCIITNIWANIINFNKLNLNITIAFIIMCKYTKHISGNQIMLPISYQCFIPITRVPDSYPGHTITEL